MSLNEDMVRAEIAALLAHVQNQTPEPERDHQSLILATLVMERAEPGCVEEVRAIWPIGTHSIVEFVKRSGKRAEIDYAALQSDDPKYAKLREYIAA